MKHQDLSERIIGAAYAVHKELGCGFLEKVYRNALAIELEENGLKCISEVPLRVLYHDRTIGEYFADLVVEDTIIVETKAIAKLDAVHEVQLVNYLKATGAHNRLVDQLRPIRGGETPGIRCFAEIGGALTLTQKIRVNPCESVSNRVSVNLHLRTTV